MESEETHDYVRESKDMDQVEVEEMSFVPSEISVPQKFLCRHSQSNEKNFSIWQFASVVMKEGEEHTRPFGSSNVTTRMWRKKGTSVSLLRKRRIVEGSGT